MIGPEGISKCPDMPPLFCTTGEGPWNEILIEDRTATNRRAESHQNQG